MHLKDHHTKQEMQTLYRTEKDARLARRMHAIYLAARGLSCPQIMTITGAARRTIQQWVRKYNKQGIDGLKDKPRPGQPTKLPRRDELRFCKRIVAGPTNLIPVAETVFVIPAETGIQLFRSEFLLTQRVTSSVFVFRNRN